MRMESELFQNILPSDYAAWVKNVADEQLQNLPRFMKNNYKVWDFIELEEMAVLTYWPRE